MRPLVDEDFSNFFQVCIIAQFASWRSAKVAAAPCAAKCLIVARPTRLYHTSRNQHDLVIKYSLIIRVLQHWQLSQDSGNNKPTQGAAKCSQNSPVKVLAGPGPTNPLDTSCVDIPRPNFQTPTNPTSGSTLRVATPAAYVSVGIHTQFA